MREGCATRQLQKKSTAGFRPTAGRAYASNLVKQRGGGWAGGTGEYVGDNLYGDLPYMVIDPPGNLPYIGFWSGGCYVTDDESAGAIEAAGDSRYA